MHCLLLLLLPLPLLLRLQVASVFSWVGFIDGRAGHCIHGSCWPRRQILSRH